MKNNVCIILFVTVNVCVRVFFFSYLSDTESGQNEIKDILVFSDSDFGENVVITEFVFTLDARCVSSVSGLLRIPHVVLTVQVQVLSSVYILVVLIGLER